jgi:hypothetical protein
MPNHTIDLYPNSRIRSVDAVLSLSATDMYAYALLEHRGYFYFGRHLSYVNCTEFHLYQKLREPAEGIFIFICWQKLLTNQKL